MVTIPIQFGTNQGTSGSSSPGVTLMGLFKIGGKSSPGNLAAIATQHTVITAKWSES
jgi:hypothetical protein